MQARFAVIFLPLAKVIFSLRESDIRALRE
jgi:hypothetical protein